ncbi:uncharacterized protein DUF2167 [Chitinophaga niastensis]|uniref:Uncharacterized protein DUF2167 n=1 Tax=Chitinophaga niastensis TaxID=536980 RepID=A0A2P8HPH8_CHINA|nr:DUF2167 domain-containing protein [Chitinophaga niastensis]PSL48128.1 uncharacterized protein DUF2167 [Chitinophaga niastensis]
MRTFYFSLLIICSLGPLNTFASNREDSLGKYDKLDSIDMLTSSFTYKVGEQQLGNVATLQVPDGYRFLDATQSRVLVEHVWGNPENPNSLGLLLPARVGPLDKDVWGFLVSYEPSGYLDEGNARLINYTTLLEEMKEDLRKENVLRQGKGFGIITSMDWAFPPYYDKKTHALHWARILHFRYSHQSILNYEVRLLGRRGALCFTAVGNPSQLNLIQKQLKSITGVARFTNGNNYTDFNPRTDGATMWVPEASTVSRILSPVNLLLWLRNTWLLLIVSCCMVLFVYAMQYYHRRKPTYRKMIHIDESLN